MNTPDEKAHIDGVVERFISQLPKKKQAALKQFLKKSGGMAKIGDIAKTVQSTNGNIMDAVAGYLSGADVTKACGENALENLPGCDPLNEMVDGLNCTPQETREENIENTMNAAQTMMENVLRTKPIRKEEASIGRNAPCPCGSGKKYKKCCINKKRK